MDFFAVRVELLLRLFARFDLRFRPSGNDALGEFQSVAELVDDFFFIRAIAMERETEFFQAEFFQLVIDHVQGGAFLRDEEDFLPLGEAFRDHIRDGLALARAGRSLQDKALSALRQQDGLILAGVRVYDVMQLLGLVRGFRLFERRQIQERADIRILQNRGGILLEVFIHIDLHKGEEPHFAFRSDGPAESLHQFQDLVVIFLHGRFFVVRRDDDAVFALQFISEGGVDRDIGGDIEEIRGGGGFAFDGDGCEQDGSMQNVLFILLFRPFDEAESRVSDVHARFLHRGVRSLLDILQSGVRLPVHVISESDVILLQLGSVFCEKFLLGERLSARLFVDLRIEDLKARGFLAAVENGRKVREEQLDGGCLRILEVDEVIPFSRVEKEFRPFIQTFIFHFHSFFPL